MDASATVAAPSGTYYVRIDGVGKGSALTDGYSDYASIGTLTRLVEYLAQRTPR